MAEDKNKKKPQGKESEGDEDLEAAAPKKKSKKVLFIVSGLVLLIIAIGVPLVMFMGKDKKVESKSAEAVEVDTSKETEDAHKLSKEAEVELEEGEELLGAIAPLDAFVVNLKGGRFIRLQVQLEFVERDVPNRLAQRAAIIRDAIITLLTTKSADEVLERDGKERLRKDLRALVNEALHKELVKQVYFTQFVVQ
jgi:flagellar FliL protein